MDVAGPDPVTFSFQPSGEDATPYSEELSVDPPDPESESESYPEDVSSAPAVPEEECAEFQPSSEDSIDPAPLEDMDARSDENP